MLLHIRSLAGYTIDMLESSFWKRQEAKLSLGEKIVFIISALFFVLILIVLFIAYHAIF